MRNYIVAILVLLLFACENDSKLEKEIAAIDLDFNVERFDRALATAQASDLNELKQAFPFLFSKRIPDSIWISRIQADTLQSELLEEVDKIHGNFNTTTEELMGLFQHLKYYDKTFNIPRIVTLTNDVDYRNKTIVNDTLMLIALDNYLGRKHPFYQNIQMYLSENLEPNQIVTDLAQDYSTKYIYQPKRKTLLDEMIYFGKQLYFKDVMIPFKSDAEKIGYSPEDIDWAEANEDMIWKYFVEKEMLYKTDSKLIGRFLAPAPFSKFYLELDNESPGRLGQYIGWQILRAYAKRTDDDFLKIMQTEPGVIFQNSKYKPKK